jgi:hypothetical protein
LSFTSKTGKRLQVAGDPLRQEFQCHEPMKTRVLGPVNNTHTAAAQLFEDAVMGNGGANEWVRAFHLPLILGWRRRQVNELNLDGSPLGTRLASS